MPTPTSFSPFRISPEWADPFEPSFGEIQHYNDAYSRAQRGEHRNSVIFNLIDTRWEDLGGAVVFCTNTLYHPDQAQQFTEDQREHVLDLSLGRDSRFTSTGLIIAGLLQGGARLEPNYLTIATIHSRGDTTVALPAHALEPAEFRAPELLLPHQQIES
jgi:hypothetical protein